VRVGVEWKFYFRDERKINALSGRSKYYIDVDCYNLICELGLQWKFYFREECVMATNDTSMCDCTMVGLSALHILSNHKQGEPLIGPAKTDGDRQAR
jgi:hypothetical protein